MPPVPIAIDSVSRVTRAVLEHEFGSLSVSDNAFTRSWQAERGSTESRGITYMPTHASNSATTAENSTRIVTPQEDSAADQGRTA
jgi:hypothetical protein